MIGIQIDQIHRDQHPNGVNPLRRNHPDPLIGLQPESAYQSSQPGEMSVRCRDSEAQERLSRFIENAIALPRFPLTLTYSQITFPLRFPARAPSGFPDPGCDEQSQANPIASTNARSTTLDENDQYNHK